MRILNLAYTCPWPPRGGNDQRVWHLCRLIGKKAEQTLLCRVTDPSDAGQFTRFHGEAMDVINLYLPRPSRLARTLTGLRFLAGPNPIMTGGFYFPLFHETLKSLVHSNRFDVIVMDGIYLGIYWPLLRKSRAFKVLNHFDIESLSLRRKSALLRTNWEKCLFRLDAARMERLERRIMRTADLVWVTSTVDRDLLFRIDPQLPIRVAPNGVDCDAIARLPASDNHEILFVGTLGEFANADAVQYFVREVFPLVKKLVPDAVFRVVGRNPSPEILALKRFPGVDVTGPVEDTAPWYRRCAAAVVPIRAGGGTRLKILEAMAYGRPVVSTTIGCEGIEAVPRRDVMIADRPDVMAAAVHEVLSSPALAASLALAARKLVETRYSWRQIAEHMHSVYDSCCSGRCRENRLVETQMQGKISWRQKSSPSIR